MSKWHFEVGDHVKLQVDHTALERYRLPTWLANYTLIIRSLDTPMYGEFEDVGCARVVRQPEGDRWTLPLVWLVHARKPNEVVLEVDGV